MTWPARHRIALAPGGGRADGRGTACGAKPWTGFVLRFLAGGKAPGSSAPACRTSDGGFVSSALGSAGVLALFLRLSTCSAVASFPADRGGHGGGFVPAHLHGQAMTRRLDATVLARHRRNGFVPRIALCTRDWVRSCPAAGGCDIGFALDSIEGRSEVVKPVRTRARCGGFVSAGSSPGCRTSSREAEVLHGAGGATPPVKRGQRWRTLAVGGAAPRGRDTLVPRARTAV
jgi:hypothetical protein